MRKWLLKTGALVLKEYLRDRRIIFMAIIKIKQIKSRIGAPADQKRTLDALGLRKMNRVVEHEDNPSILGMVNKVKHLVTIVK